MICDIKWMGHLLPSLTTHIPQIVRDHAFDKYLFAAVQKQLRSPVNRLATPKRQIGCSIDQGMSKNV